MATNFPASLDTFTYPLGTDAVNAVEDHASRHADHYDATAALEAKVGVTSSAVTTTLEYRLHQLELGRIHSPATRTYGRTNWR